MAAVQASPDPRLQHHQDELANDTYNPDPATLAAILGVLEPWSSFRPRGPDAVAPRDR